MLGSYEARKDSFKNIGLQTSLTYQDWCRGVTGFFQNLTFEETVWFCPVCKKNPPYFVADGKEAGPTKRKVDHLRELGQRSQEALSQGSHFRDRTLIPNKKDRQKILNLLSNETSIEEFLMNGLESQNGILLIQLMTRLDYEYGEIKPEYHKFLSNICMANSVTGMLNVTSPEPLSILTLFCQREIDLRTSAHYRELKVVEKEVPPLWTILIDILTFENDNFLPPDIQNVILKILEIRSNIFRNAAIRHEEDYTPWDRETDHPTMFYPCIKLLRYPRNYTVSGTKDDDICAKRIQEKRDFSHGIFSVGCCCKYNITYGYELMLQPESTHNLFRFLMSRDIKKTGENRLKGVVYDNACNLNQYVLNREPREFEFLRMLVDGSHWSGHKKYKNNKSKKQRGHLGCCDGFNFNQYKGHLPRGIYSQGREQTHAVLDKLVTSLRQMNYRNFMNFMRIFFALNNLKNRKQI